MNGSGAFERSSSDLLGHAVHRHSALSLEGLLERVFTLAFSKLVYPQIWEDPIVDLEALDVRPDSRIVTIASGGCNTIHYLVADPAHITAVDLNAAHVALTRLKLAAAERLPDYRAYYSLLGAADAPANITAYNQYLRPYLDQATRSYWEARDWLGRRRIARFSRKFFRFGLLGRCIGAGHLLARAYGKDPRRLTRATTLAEQRALFEQELAPLFERTLVRWLLDHRWSLYGLGIPPAQYAALSGGQRMAQVVRSRLERLACGFEFKDNYFAWQAFHRGYAPERAGPLPPYLQPENFDLLRERARRVAVHHESMTSFLARQPAASFDRYVLLDAQDWMSDADLARLWLEITRTARVGARVIFRTAGSESPLPGRLPEALQVLWRYEAERSLELGRRDRSAVYGGFHLYVLTEEFA